MLFLQFGLCVLIFINRRMKHHLLRGPGTRGELLLLDFSFENTHNSGKKNREFEDPGSSSDSNPFQVMSEQIPGPSILLPLLNKRIGLDDA